MMFTKPMRCWRTLTAIFLIATADAKISDAQDSVSLPVSRFSIGMSVGHYHSDLGLMLTVTSPYFMNRVATRISGGFLWSDLYFVEKSRLRRYSGLQTGLIFRITDQQRVRVYAEAGLSALFPNRTFSDKKAVSMFYGLSGLEFYFRRNWPLRIIYFIEVGVIANTNKAEKLEGQPGYCDGIMGRSGFRFQW